MNYYEKEQLRIVKYLAQDKDKVYEKLSEDQANILKSLINLPKNLDKETFAKHTFHKFQNLLNKNLKEETYEAK